MNEEEKQVIIRLQSNRDKLKENFSYTKLSKKWLSEDIDEAINLIDKQQKEIERLKKESIGNTKYERLLFSIRMLHFHHYINDNQFIKMINKLSNENKGE